jgi:hypothetical protein
LSRCDNPDPFRVGTVFSRVSHHPEWSERKPKKHVALALLRAINLIMKTLLIRDVPDELHDLLVSEAARNRRSKEKQALYLIETSLATRPADTCSELLERLWIDPPPDVDPDAIDAYLATRGKRCNRHA